MWHCSFLRHSPSPPFTIPIPLLLLALILGHPSCRFNLPSLGNTTFFCPPPLPVSLPQMYIQCGNEELIQPILYNPFQFVLFFMKLCNFVHENPLGETICVSCIFFLCVMPLASLDHSTHSNYNPTI